MIRSILLVSLLTINGFTVSRPQSDFAHDRWLQERHFEAISIKVGMTRADLLKVFRMDGGLQSLLPTRYVLKSSNFIKVDVEFDVPEGEKGKVIPEDLRFEMESPAFDFEGKPAPGYDYRFVPNDNLKIKSISRPYLEQFNLD